MVGANSKESPACRLDQGVGGELEPTEGDVVGDRAESGQGGMLAGEGKAELAAVLPKQALPPLDLGLSESRRSGPAAASSLHQACSRSIASWTESFWERVRGKAASPRRARCRASWFLAKLLVTTPSSHRRVLGCLDDRSPRLHLAKVAELRPHGIEVAEYDEPGLKTVDGVADVGFALSAWFVDPGRNTIGQIRARRQRPGPIDDLLAGPPDL
jgi:hypothetical protein